MATVCGAFNNHVDEFFEDVKRVAPDDKDIMAAETAVAAAKKANVTLFIKAWIRYTSPYSEQIYAKDTTFFLAKDYENDVNTGEDRGALLETIERVRRRVSSMGDDEKTKIMDYIYNLTVLSSMYKPK